MSSIFAAPSGDIGKFVRGQGGRRTFGPTDQGTLLDRIVEENKRRSKAARLAPFQEGIELRRRIAARGGAQSTLLGGTGAATSGNVFKGNLGGTGRR